MLAPADYHPGTLSFKFKVKKSKKPKSKQAKKESLEKDIHSDEKNSQEINPSDNLTLEQKEELVAVEMTSAELKFQKNRINYLKNTWEATKGKSYKDLIEEQNEKLAKIPLHYDLEGK